MSQTKKPNQNDQDHTIPQVPNVEDTTSQEAQFEEPVASPSVVGEEDPFSGDATSSESPDIDEELQKVGLRGDEEHGPKSLDIDKELEEETL